MDADDEERPRIAKDGVACRQLAVAWRRQKVARRGTVLEGMYDYLGTKENTQV